MRAVLIVSAVLAAPSAVAASQPCRGGPEGEACKEQEEERDIQGMTVQLLQARASLQANGLLPNITLSETKANGLLPNITLSETKANGLLPNITLSETNLSSVNPTLANLGSSLDEAPWYTKLGGGACDYATYLRKIDQPTTVTECAALCSHEPSCAYFSQRETGPYSDKCYLYSSCPARESYLANVWTTYIMIDKVNWVKPPNAVATANCETHGLYARNVIDNDPNTRWGCCAGDVGLEDAYLMVDLGKPHVVKAIKFEMTCTTLWRIQVWYNESGWDGVNSGTSSGCQGRFTVVATVDDPRMVRYVEVWHYASGYGSCYGVWDASFVLDSMEQEVTTTTATTATTTTSATVTTAVTTEWFGQ